MCNVYMYIFNNKPNIIQSAIIFKMWNNFAKIKVCEFKIVIK